MSRPHSTGGSQFRFCPFCAAPLEETRVEGSAGELSRRRCPACGYVQYRNPIVGVAAVILEPDLHPERHDPGAAPRVLLGRRVKRMSRGGLWCLPCGYVEFDEEVREALAREVLEETGLIAEAGEIFSVQSNFHDPDRQTVGIWFRVRVTGGVLRPADDLDDLRFVAPDDPGLPLAFPTDAFVLTKLAEGAQ